jgi:hypothetical protein
MSGRNRSRKVQEIIGRMTLPRVQMFIILAVTGMAGFGASAFLLRWGLTSMAVRYPLVVALSYLVFLLLLRAWISMYRDSWQHLDVPIDGGWPVGSSVRGTHVFGGGGDYAGAGSGGEWSEAVGFSSGGGSDSILPDVDVGLDSDDIGAIILAVIAIAAALLAIFYVVYIAPVLLAEILLDGAIVAELYRSMKNVERRNWLTTAVRKTIIPATLTVALFAVAGYFLQKAVPEAESIGQVWAAFMA